MARLGGSEVVFRIVQSVRKKINRKDEQDFPSDFAYLVRIIAQSQLVFLIYPPRNVEHFFRLERSLGAGGFGSVYATKLTKLGAQRLPMLSMDATYALKRMAPMPPEARKSTTPMVSGPPIVNALRRGLSPERVQIVLKGFGNPDCQHVCRLYATLIECPLRINSLMELLEGPDLHEYLAASTARPTESQAACVVRQMLAALEYFHFTLGVVHRDIKLENMCFVTSPDRDKAMRGFKLPPIKIIDVGMAFVLQAPATEETARECESAPRAGTTAYMAPETWEHLTGPGTDVWGVGIVTYALHSMEFPFSMHSASAKKTVEKCVREGVLEFAAPVWSEVSAPAKEFLSAALEKDRKLRATARELLASAWLASSAAECGASAPKGVSTAVSATLSNGGLHARTHAETSPGSITLWETLAYAGVTA